MNEEESQKYLEIVKSGNMDDMFDFAYKKGVADFLERLPKPEEKHWAKSQKGIGWNNCLEEIKKLGEKFLQAIDKGRQISN